MWQEADTWPAALQGLLDRRLATFGDQLRAEVPRFDLLETKLRALIADLPNDPLGVLHGDLIPANVLVDEALHPVAVLDFGFFTTVGDPAFDLAVTASIFDMYGPLARQVETEIDRAAAERFGFPPERLTLYRAAYAIATANVYDPDGKDGHFRWCTEMLRRDEITDLLSTGRL
jgi:aminoglycoside phosphotransferase (APT) family kinase protein